MIANIPLIFLALAMPVFEDRPTKPVSPSVADLETALRSERFGAEPKALTPAQTFLRMTAVDVPDHLLLAILIQGTIKGDPVEKALEILGKTSGRIERIFERTLLDEVGISENGRARLLAASELARRAAYRAAAMRVEPILTPRDAALVLMATSTGPLEKLSAIYLDNKSRPISVVTISVGSDKLTIVDPREIFRIGVEQRANACILAHQHPSGDPTPSTQDIMVTERVGQAGNLLGIPLIDHIVLGGEGKFLSIRERRPDLFAYSTPYRSTT